VQTARVAQLRLAGFGSGGNYGYPTPFASIRGPGKLLASFVQNPNQVLSRDQLLELVWGDPYGVSGDQVKLYVGYLRRKLVPDAPDEAPIETVRGFGYRYRKTQA